MSDLTIQDLDSAPCGFLTFSDDGTIFSANLTLVKQLGFADKSSFIGENIETLLTIAGKIFYQTHLFPLLKLHGHAEEIFLTLRGKDKGGVPVICNFERKTEAGNNLNHCILFSIRQRGMYEQELLLAKKQAEEALKENKELLKAKSELEASASELDRKLMQVRQMNQNLVEFGKVISHDFQEPIRKISLFSDRIVRQNKALIKESGIADLDKINIQCAQMRQLVISLERFIALNFQVAELGYQDIGKILANALERVMEATGVSDIKFIMTDIPGIDGYGGQLETMFYNILHNAVSYRDPARPLVINMEATIIRQNPFKESRGRVKYVDFAQIIIADNGLGFDPDSRQDVFRILRNPDNNIKQLSFGLAFSKKIADNHYGSISIDSEKGQGTRVTVLLPVRQSAF